MRHPQGNPSSRVKIGQLAADYVEATNDPELDTHPAEDEDVGSFGQHRLPFRRDGVEVHLEPRVGAPEHHAQGAAGPLPSPDGWQRGIDVLDVVREQLHRSVEMAVLEQQEEPPDHVGL